MSQIRRNRPSVLFINRVYPPGDGATGEMLADVATDLVRQGWQVSVVTSTCPGAPRDAMVGGVRVVRVAGVPFRRGSLLFRALAYICLYPALLFRALRLPAHDVVVTKTDPPLQLTLGPIIKLFKRSRAVHWAQDVYPEIAEVLGVIRPGGPMAELLRAVSRRALNRHDRVIAIGRCMGERLQSRGLDPEHLTVVPNWPAHGVSPVAHEDNRFRRENGLDERFVVMYSDNIGLAHEFDAILGAATLLQHTLPNAVIAFVGDGPRLGDLVRQIEQRHLRNVRFLPRQPKALLAESLGAADIHLVSMQESASGLVVPSKVYGVLAAGRPCLFLGPADSEAARLISENRCGDVLPSCDGEHLAERILAWYALAGERDAAGLRAWRAVASAREQSFSQFNMLLRDLTWSAAVPAPTVTSQVVPYEA